jgi:predicted PolB exonuclease-like 3'-5' exonuclease
MSLSKRGLNSETLSTTYLVAICDRMHQEFIHFNVFSEIDPDDMLGGLLLRVAGYTRKSHDLGWDYYLIGYDDYADKIEDALNILYYMCLMEHQKSQDKSDLAQRIPMGRLTLPEASLVVGSPRYIKSGELNESIKNLSATLAKFSETLDSIIKY